jgi:site-specific recombinase XerD
MLVYSARSLLLGYVALKAQRMTEKVVWHVVKTYGKRLEIPKLAPHDLRRSCAPFCHAAGG